MTKKSTLTLSKSQESKSPEKAEKTLNILTTPDLHNMARDILRNNLLVIAGGVCPGHETIMAENILRALDLLIATALDARFEQSFGPATAQNPDTTQ